MKVEINNTKEEEINIPCLMYGVSTSNIYYIIRQNAEFYKGVHLSGKNQGALSTFIIKEKLKIFKGSITLSND